MVDGEYPENPMTHPTMTHTPKTPVRVKAAFFLLKVEYFFVLMVYVPSPAIKSSK